MSLDPGRYGRLDLGTLNNHVIEVAIMSWVLLELQRPISNPF